MRWLSIAVGACTLLVAASGATYAQAGTKLVAVAQGISTVDVHNDTVFGNTDPSTPEHIAFVAFQARNLHDLQSRVADGMHGRYLSVSEFARQYGQTQQNIQALQAYLTKFGIQTTSYADGLDVSASGTAGQFDQALQVQQKDYLKPAVASHDGQRAQRARHFHQPAGPPLLPRNLAQFVTAIIGLSNYPVFESHLIRAPQVDPAHKPKVRTGDLTPADFAKQYNLPRGSGAGTTIGIITFASVDPSVPPTFWSSVLGIHTKPNRITLEQIDGGSGPVSDALGSGETTIDVEQSGALAPQANIIVYEAANGDVGSFDAFAAAASENRADTVSMSWGFSETIIQWAIKNGLEASGFQQAQDELSLEMAAQGQSMFVSSADSGAYTATQDLGTTDLSIDNPDDSPWITSAGGTTLPGVIPLTDTVSATIPRERAWGWDWLWPYYASLCEARDDSGNCVQYFPSEQEFAFVAGIAGGGGGLQQPRADAGLPA